MLPYCTCEKTNITVPLSAHLATCSCRPGYLLVRPGRTNQNPWRHAKLLNVNGECVAKCALRCAVMLGWVRLLPCKKTTITARLSAHLAKCLSVYIWRRRMLPWILIKTSLAVFTLSLLHKLLCVPAHKLLCVPGSVHIESASQVTVRP